MIIEHQKRQETVPTLEFNILIMGLSILLRWHLYAKMPGSNIFEPNTIHFEMPLVSWYCKYSLSIYIYCIYITYIFYVYVYVLWSDLQLKFMFQYLTSETRPTGYLCGVWWLNDPSRVSDTILLKKQKEVTVDGGFLCKIYVFDTT